MHRTIITKRYVKSKKINVFLIKYTMCRLIFIRIYFTSSQIYLHVKTIVKRALEVGHFKHCQCSFSLIFNAERIQSLHNKPESPDAAVIATPVVVIVVLITVIVVVVILRYLFTF